jgi:hypothetical protein
MTMRSYLAQSLRDSAGLASLGLVPAGVLAADVDTVALRPFVQFRWQPTSRGITKLSTGPIRRSLNLWFHDQPNDFTRIDDMIFVVRALWSDLEGVDHGAGRIILAEWQGDSADFSDTAMETIGRFSTYRIVGTEGVTP